jgi:hypothetical protein
MPGRTHEISRIEAFSDAVFAKRQAFAARLEHAPELQPTAG